MTMFLMLDLGVAEPDPEAIHRQANRWLGDRADEVVAGYRAHRPDATPADLITALTTDAVFRIPAIRLAEAQVRQWRPTWMYWFTWATPVMGGVLKSCHALELPFMWDALDRPGLAMLTGDGPERQGIADAMHAAWIRFAREGDPGWPQYDLDHRRTMRFDVNSEIVEDPDGPERELWDGLG
jgi:para-nitrobenzyl esterase